MAKHVILPSLYVTVVCLVKCGSLFPTSDGSSVPHPGPPSWSTGPLRVYLEPSALFLCGLIFPGCQSPSRCWAYCTCAPLSLLTWECHACLISSLSSCPTFETLEGKWSQLVAVWSSCLGRDWCLIKPNVDWVQRHTPLIPALGRHVPVAQGYVAS